ncbi:MAG: response regulator [Chitinispirillaceae bacterium]|nr:response regulator [Chitinispirillaceae bacterium]
MRRLNDLTRSSKALLSVLSWKYTSYKPAADMFMDNTILFYFIVATTSLLTVAAGVLVVLLKRKVRKAFDDLARSFDSLIKKTAAAELERKLTDEKRTQAEHQLAHAQKMEAIGHLAGGIAHDFNNIITAIGGYASLLKKRMDAKEPSANYVEHIIDAGRHAKMMINQLSMFVKNDQPQVELLDVHSVISASISMLPADVGEGITLSADLKARPSFTSGDTTLLKNVFLNLVINACDACEKGTGSIAFGTEAVTLDSGNMLCRSFSIDPGPFIRITVSDNGRGMGGEVLDRIFEPFFTTKPKGKGMGLGLSNVWRYIETFKGAIEVRSKPGEGTSFFIYLPLIEIPTSSSPSAPAVTSPQPSRRTILIVDDEPSVREIYSEILIENGYVVHTAGDGREAIDILDKNAGAIDLVLLDMIMPRMNGTDTFHAIRTRFPQMRILLMSGSLDQEKVASLLQEPATAFFQKPCDDEQLIQHVRSIVVSPPAP